LIAGKYQVIQNRQVNGFACTSQFPHCHAIRPARSRIPARMVVRHDNARAAQLRSVDDDLPHRQSN
jgi:hypothetical protein